MTRPRCCRRLGDQPPCRRFKPTGIPAVLLEEVVLHADEYEAIRLADHLGLYHRDAAERMGISRQTFGRTVESARRKVARALTEGLTLAIEAAQDEAGDTSLREPQQG
ncbi:MAG: DUF134 domain-containing protein [Bacteroidota bacterium]